MAEINPAEISAILKQQLEGFSSGASLEEVGTVLQVGDGIARVYGLSNAQYGELVQFDNGLEAIVLNLEEDNVGVVLLGPSTGIREGSTVKRTQRIASLKVGEGIVGRVVNADGSFDNLETVKVVGDDLSFYHATQENRLTPEFAKRTEQAFGKGTFNLLKTLKVGVVGCSGTGSPVIEQLARLGIGELVLVDPDCIEEKNLNRILNSTIEDVLQQTPKVELMKRTIKNIGLGTSVETHAQNLFDPRVIKAIASCDIVFGCMDSVDGRHLLNRLATFYSIPYIDVGIRLVADGKGGIDQICGGVHYLQPAQSLLERGLYTPKDLEAANLLRVDPESYKERLEDGYISGVVEDRPAVISVNMFFASLAVMEMLGRLHQYRNEPNSEYSIWQVSLSDSFLEHSSNDSTSSSLENHIGKGDVCPLLRMPSLSERR